MNTQGLGLYTGMLKLVTFSLMQSSAQKYQILASQSCMTTQKHTLAPVLQAQCELLQPFFGFLLWSTSLSETIICTYPSYIALERSLSIFYFYIEAIALLPDFTIYELIPLLGNLGNFGT